MFSKVTFVKCTFYCFASFYFPWLCFLQDKRHCEAVQGPQHHSCPVPGGGKVISTYNINFKMVISTYNIYKLSNQVISTYNIYYTIQVIGTYNIYYTIQVISTYNTNYKIIYCFLISSDWPTLWRFDCYRFVYFHIMYSIHLYLFSSATHPTAEESLIRNAFWIKIIRPVSFFYFQPNHWLIKYKLKRTLSISTWCIFLQTSILNVQLVWEAEQVTKGWGASLFLLKI